MMLNIIAINIHRKIIPLSIGGGIRDFAAYYIELGAKLVTGIDISSNMIAHAKTCYVHEGLFFEQVASF